MELTNLTKILENRPNTSLEIINSQDQGDGSISLDAILKDSYTSETLISLSWRYDLAELLTELNRLPVVVKLAAQYEKPPVRFGYLNEF